MLNEVFIIVDISTGGWVCPLKVLLYNYQQSQVADASSTYDVWGALVARLAG